MIKDNVAVVVVVVVVDDDDDEEEDEDIPRFLARDCSSCSCCLCRCLTNSNVFKSRMMASKIPHLTLRPTHSLELIRVGGREECLSPPLVAIPDGG